MIKGIKISGLQQSLFSDRQKWNLEQNSVHDLRALKSYIQYILLVIYLQGLQKAAELYPSGLKMLGC